MFSPKDALQLLTQESKVKALSQRGRHKQGRSRAL